LILSSQSLPFQEPTSQPCPVLDSSDMETLAFPQDGRLLSQQAVVDLRSGGTDERLRRENPEGRHTYYSALCGQTLLGWEFDGKARRTNVMIRADLPDYKEVSRPSHSGGEPEALGNITISADRKKNLKRRTSKRTACSGPASYC
jgi:hypothetical protein